MLVNIWATVTHLGDSHFCGADLRTEPSVDVLISDGLRRATRSRQTWMVNPLWLSPGTTGELLRVSYPTIRDAIESYLLLITPGFADVLQEVPADLMRTQLSELLQRGRVFKKRPITVLLGTPPNSPGDVARRLSEWNRVVQEVTENAEGVVADLRSIAYEDWTPIGSRPMDLADAAVPLVQAVVDSHPS